GKYRVLRGGSWFVVQRGARCIVRGRDDPGYFYNLVGFRVVVSRAPEQTGEMV
nr:SUMF1/EgtB/PvdO family nonheme iron enzyme [Thermoflexales bacterium]